MMNDDDETKTGTHVSIDGEDACSDDDPSVKSGNFIFFFDD